jgi:protein TilB
MAQCYNEMKVTFDFIFFSSYSVGDLDFTIKEDREFVEIDISVGKYVDTSLLQIDLQPRYVNVLVKQKALTLNLPNEIKVSESAAQRSQTTGKLLLKLKKVNPTEIVGFPKATPPKPKSRNLNEVVDIKNIVKKKIEDLDIPDDIPDLEDS